MNSKILEEHLNTFIFKENREKFRCGNSEYIEQIQSAIHVPKDGIVLELGARYGSVSGIINKIVNNPEKHVAVEPDEDVIPALTKNKGIYGSKFLIFNGIVTGTKKDYYLKIGIDSGYGNYTTDIPNGNIRKVKKMDIKELEEKIGRKFDILVADCEGYLEKFFDEYDPSQFKLIIMEDDNKIICNYDKIYKLFQLKGFIRIDKEKHHLVFINQNFLPFTILSFSVDYGNLGFFGRIGYMTEYENFIPNYIRGNTVSCHANSKLIIISKKYIKLTGFCICKCYNGNLEFFVNNDKLSYDSEKMKTNTIDLFPNIQYILEIKANPIDNAHTIWEFN
jgi:hypothetical protein